jgi:hypothetical protein
MFWLFWQLVGVGIVVIAVVSVLYFGTWLIKIAVSSPPKPEDCDFDRVRF